jgi:hypothetical protein
MSQDLSAFRPSRLLKRMPPEKRADAAELFWSDEQSTDQQIEAVTALAAHMKFRAKSVIGLPLERKTKYLLALPTMPDSIAARALVAYHLARQRPMMGAFLEALGIAHEDGLISDENLPAPDAEKLQIAAAELATKYPEEDVALYLSTLVSQDPDTWKGLAELPETKALATVS